MSQHKAVRIVVVVGSGEAATNQLRDGTTYILLIKMGSSTQTSLHLIGQSMSAMLLSFSEKVCLIQDVQLIGAGVNSM